MRPQIVPQQQGLQQLDKLQLSMDMILHEGAQHIAAALEQNHCLRELSIQLGNHDPSGSLSSIVEPIANMLRVNHSLEWIELSRNLWDDNAARAFAQALKQNETLKVLVINFDTPSPRNRHNIITVQGYKCLLEMLELNRTIEAIPTYGLQYDSSVRSKIDYFLKLNERGVRRVRLFMNTNHAKFLDALESEIDDLDCINYLLSMNPLLFERLVLYQNHTDLVHPGEEIC